MLKIRIITIFLLIGFGFFGWNVYQTETKGTKTFRLGLDLSGGSHLVYKADVSEIAPEEVTSSMDSLRDVIERRINAFGIAEPSVQTEEHSLGIDGTEQRLVVELPGITNLDDAVAMIGQTPLLEFKTEAPQEEQERINAELQALLDTNTAETPVSEQALLKIESQRYVSSGLTGKYLEKAQLQFPQSGQPGSLQTSPFISLSFNREGAVLFEKITTENVGKTLAIYLDGFPVSAPVVNTPISGGQAVIEGTFTLEEAKEVVARLNSGALPIPIQLISTNTIGPSLGADAVDAGVFAGIIAFALIAGMLIFWYRLPGVIATLALGVYTIITLWLFKLIPVTLTSAGIAGFVISIGMAVDANILIFERMKEELAGGKSLYESIEIGFKRAWASIRDGNISSLISAFFLFWFGTPLIKGFALTFGLGVFISMFSAITVSRLMLMSLVHPEKEPGRVLRFLYKSGFNK